MPDDAGIVNEEEHWFERPREEATLSTVLPLDAEVDYWHGEE